MRAPVMSASGRLQALTAGVPGRARTGPHVRWFAEIAAGAQAFRRADPPSGDAAQRICLFARHSLDEIAAFAPGCSCYARRSQIVQRPIR
jgi:hypothetical protein